MLKGENLKTSQVSLRAVFQLFSISKFQRFSQSAADFGDDRRKDADELVGFFMEKLGWLTAHAAVLHQQLQPQLRFIGLLE